MIEKYADDRNLPVLFAVGIAGFAFVVAVVVGLVLVVDLYVLGLENDPARTPAQASFELDRSEQPRVVHVGGDEINSSNLVISRNGTWNSTWTALAGWSEARTVSERDAVPLPEVERGEEISVVYVDNHTRATLFRKRV